MASANRLPRLETCIDLYLAASDRYGSDSFTAEQLDRDVSIPDPRRTLELVIAYGLVVPDESAYRIAREPDASADAWESVARDRARLIREAIARRNDDGEATETRVLTHEANEYVSVFVATSDDLDAIVERIESLPLKDYDGVVLRAPGNDANRIQRFADRFCDSTPSESPLSIPHQKEYSDVTGNAKTELEFQLYLKQC